MKILLCDVCKIEPAIGIFGEYHSVAHCKNCMHPCYKKSYENSSKEELEKLYFPFNYCY